MNDNQLLRYSRQIMLPLCDIEGQQKLLAAKVLIVGAGGLGSPAAMYLAAAGVGNITIYDDDIGIIFLLNLLMTLTPISMMRVQLHYNYPQQPNFTT